MFCLPVHSCPLLVTCTPTQRQPQFEKADAFVAVWSHLVQQDGEGVQEVVVTALKDVHHTDQAAAHVSAHLHLKHSTQYVTH